MPRRKADLRTEKRQVVDWIIETGIGSPWPISSFGKCERRNRDGSICGGSHSKQPLNGPDGRTWAGSRNVPLTPDEIDRLWPHDPNPRATIHDIAFICGPGFFVLDLDTKTNPELSAMFAELDAMTLCATTPHDGLHAYFRTPRDRDGNVTNARVWTPAEGVDIRGAGGLVIVPPSRDRTWTNSLPIAEWRPRSSHEASTGP